MSAVTTACSHVAGGNQRRGAPDPSPNFKNLFPVGQPPALGPGGPGPQAGVRRITELSRSPATQSEPLKSSPRQLSHRAPPRRRPRRRLPRAAALPAFTVTSTARAVTSEWQVCRARLIGGDPGDSLAEDSDNRRDHNHHGIMMVSDGGPARGASSLDHGPPGPGRRGCCQRPGACQSLWAL